MGPEFIGFLFIFCWGGSLTEMIIKWHVFFLDFFLGGEGGGAQKLALPFMNWCLQTSTNKSWSFRLGLRLQMKLKMNIIDSLTGQSWALVLRWPLGLWASCSNKRCIKCINLQKILQSVKHLSYNGVKMFKSLLLCVCTCSQALCSLQSYSSKLISSNRNSNVINLITCNYFMKLKH